MYKLSVILLLNSALVSDSVVINSYGHPVATSYSYREDGNEKGHGYGYGYSKNYGKVIVTTYLAPVPPQLMPASSYSTYVIHPVNMKGCVHEVMDNEDAGSFRRDYEVTEEDMLPMGEANEYSEPKFDTNEDGYENMVDADTDMGRYRGWHEGYRNEDNGEGYWNKLKREFDEYYNNKYREMFGEDNEAQDEDDDEDRYEPDYKLPFKYKFVDDDEDSGEDDSSESKPEYGFDPDSDGFGYRYEFKDKYGRGW